jgi:hypothetical protein
LHPMTTPDPPHPSLSQVCTPQNPQHQALNKKKIPITKNTKWC